MKPKLPSVDSNGRIVWRNQKYLIHRAGDKPAIICSYGRTEYWFNGERHREGEKPAIIEHNGYSQYFENGRYISTYREN